MLVLKVLSTLEPGSFGLLSSGALEAAFCELFFNQLLSFPSRAGHLIVEPRAVLEVVFPIVLHRGCWLSVNKSNLFLFA